MAKQSYGADTGLIKGAQALYASEIPQYDFSSITKTAGEFADVFAKLSEKKEKEVQKRRELEFKAAELAAKIDDADVSGIKLADTQKEKVQSYFESQDGRIEDIVGELKTLDEFDPKRVELKKELEKIKQARLNVVANAARLEKGLNENILDIDQGNYSPANDMNKVNIMVGVKNGEYNFDIDENGNFSFPINQAYTEQTEAGVEETKTRIDKYTLDDIAGEKSLVKPADMLRTNLTEQMKKAGDAGKRGQFDAAAKQDILATMQQLTADLNKEETLDLAAGKFGAIGGPFANMPIEDLKELQSKNPVQFKNEVINSFYRTAIDFGETGQRVYDAKNAKKLIDEQSDDPDVIKFNNKITAAEQDLGDFPSPQELDKIAKAGNEAPSFTTSIDLDGGGAKPTQFQYANVGGTVLIQAKSKFFSTPKLYATWDDVKNKNQYTR